MSHTPPCGQFAALHIAHRKRDHSEDVTSCPEQLLPLSSRQGKTSENPIDDLDGCLYVIP